MLVAVAVIEVGAAGDTSVIADDATLAALVPATVALLVQVTVNV